MGALNSLIRAGKVRAIGASAMFGYQFHNLQIIAERNGFAGFSTMQNHYNLLYREDERELIPICRQYGVSLIPYSPLAGGHLSRREWDSDSLRSASDRVSRQKYDQARENDTEITERVYALAEKRGVSMTEISLAWLLHRGVAAPIVGATKPWHFEAAVKALSLKLDEEELRSLEEPYRAHEVVGALSSNITLSK